MIARAVTKINRSGGTGVLALAFAILALVVLAGCGSSSDETVELPTGLATPGTDVPEVAVKLALTPLGDTTIPVIGVEKGYYQDVGITIEPEPYGAKLDLLGSVAPLLNKQVEVGSAFPPTVLGQLDTVKNIKAFALSDVFTGYALLAPEGQFKSVDDLMQDGASFDAAAGEVVDQVSGRSLLLADGDPSAQLFYKVLFDLSDVTAEDADTTYLKNPEITKAALAGRADFAAPSSGVDIQTLLDNGWESLISIDQMFENLDDERVLQLVGHSGYLTTDEYLSSNYETLLRFTSVMYRIIDDLQKNPEETVALYRDFVNSYTGTDLSDKGLADLYKSSYKLANFEEARVYYEPNDSVLNVDNAYNAQLATLKEDGVLKESHTAGDLFVAGQVWKDLNRYKQESDKLFDSVGDKDKDIVARAQEFYDARDYLDSYRLLASLSQ